VHKSRDGITSFDAASCGAGSKLYPSCSQRGGFFYICQKLRQTCVRPIQQLPTQRQQGRYQSNPTCDNRVHQSSITTSVASVQTRKRNCYRAPSFSGCTREAFLYRCVFAPIASPFTLRLAQSLRRLLRSANRQVLVADRAR